MSWFKRKRISLSEVKHEGSQAQQGGARIEQNPYSPGSPEYGAWCHGWYYEEYSRQPIHYGEFFEVLKSV